MRIGKRGKIRRLVAMVMAMTMLFCSSTLTAFANTSNVIQMPRNIIESVVTIKGILPDVLKARMDSNGNLTGLDEYYTVEVDALIDINVSLASPECVIKDNTGTSVTDVTLKDGLYYSFQQNGKTGVYTDKVKVAYLKLAKGEGDNIAVELYDSADQKLSGGTALLVPESEMDAVGEIEIFGLQTTTKSGKIVKCEKTSAEAFRYTRPGVKGDQFALDDITGLNEFYYVESGAELSPDKLIPCVAVELAEDNGQIKLVPLDSQGNKVIDATVYMVRDHLYQFDLKVRSLPNEHSEDDGDAYLWRGDQWIADNGDEAEGDPKVPTEDATINTVDSELKTGLEDVNLTITGRIGDTFTPAELDQKIIYVATGSKRNFEGEWFNIGRSPSDRENEIGKRTVCYFIKDYLKLNAYTDKINFFEIYLDSNDNPAVRVKMPGQGEYIELKEKDASYEAIDLYVARQSILKDIVLDEIENKTAFKPTHVQLRVPTNIMVNIKDTLYDGAFTFEKGIITVDYVDDNGESHLLIDNVTVEQDDNEELSVQQEAKMASWTKTSCKTHNVCQCEETPCKCEKIECPVPEGLDEIFDSNRVQVNVTYFLTGTLESIDGGQKIIYDADNPYEHTLTLTDNQLEESYYACPEHAGYDVILDVNYDIKQDIENGDQVLLTKIWDDKSNFYGLRPKGIILTLERSKDGEEWELVDNYQVTIEDSMNASVWTKEAIGLETYTDSEGKECQYQYRIASEKYILENNSIADDYEHYHESIDGLTVTNTVIPPKTSVSGIKTWYEYDYNGDGSNLELDAKYQPDKIYIALLKDGKYYTSRAITKTTGWEFNFTNLPKYNGTQEIVYTVREIDDNGKLVKNGESIVLNGISYAQSHTAGKNVINDSIEVSMKNIRSKAAPVTIELKANKTMSGTNAPSINSLNGVFKFKLEAVSENAKQFLPTVTEVVNSNGEVNFGEITYTEFDETVDSIEYVYKITEVGYANSLSKNPSISTSKEEIFVKVTVTLNKETNKLEAKVVYAGENGEGDNTFVNAYTKPESTSFKLKGTKTLKGQGLQDDQFTFVLTPQGDAPGSVQRVKNNADGEIIFDRIIVNETVGVRDWGTGVKTKTFTYLITEENDGEENYRYDDGEVKVKVTVKKSSDNKLEVVKITYKKDGKEVDGIEFNNRYYNTYTEKVVDTVSPKTGDGNNAALYAVICLAAVAVGFVVYKKRKDS